MGLYADKIFPWLTDRVMGTSHHAAERLSALNGAAGEILEIGVGTGLNLTHYPEGVEALTGIDLSRGMLSRARRRLGLPPFPVALIRGDASELPFEDHRFDAVVSTWNLCTISDVPRALAEVGRVLKPGGRFYFLEHGLAEEPRDRRLQEVLTPVSRLLGAGCHLNRDIPRLIANSGFRILDLHRYVMPETPSPLAFAAHLFRGSAVPAP